MTASRVSVELFYIIFYDRVSQDLQLEDGTLFHASVYNLTK